MSTEDCGSLMCKLLAGNCPCATVGLELTRSQAGKVAENSSVVKVSSASCKVAYSEASAQGEVFATFPASTPTGSGFLAKKKIE